MAPPSVASVQSSTDVVTALVDGQVRDRQQTCASRKELKKMDYPTFCKSVNGMHLIDMLGYTINDDPSQYHISVVMASDVGMPGM